MNHKLGIALRARTQQKKKRTLIECQRHAEQHKIHGGDPGLQSLEEQGDGTQKGKAGEPDGTRAPRQRKNVDRGPGWGWGSWHCIGPHNMRQIRRRDGEALLGYTACSFLRISSSESVKAVPQVTPQQFMAYLKSPGEFYT